MGLAFGSDGYRGVIGHDFTRYTIASIARACCAYARIKAPGTQIVPIGYDTRFLSETLAWYAASQVAALEMTPRVSRGPSPSPYVSFVCRQMDAPIAMQITASHNPYYYNGVKLKGRHGGSLLPADVELLQELLAADPVEREELPWPPVPGSNTFDFSAEYSSAVLKAVGWLPAGEAPEIVVDFMHGASAGLYRQVLESSCRLRHVLHAAPDPLFGGGKPEPLEASLSRLRGEVVAGRGQLVGLAFDGDGDRLAVVDETGRFLPSHVIYALLLEQLVRSGRAGSSVVTTVSFSVLVRKVAEFHGLSVHEVPVGFRHVALAMLELRPLIAGEESGGMAMGHYLPERDALLMALTLLQARADTGCNLSELVDVLYQRFGVPQFIHTDIALAHGTPAELVRTGQEDLAAATMLAGDEVIAASRLDGVKLTTRRGWVLLRSSGTEPIARFYAETVDDALTRQYLSEAIAIAGLDARSSTR